MPNRPNACYDGRMTPDIANDGALSPEDRARFGPDPQATFARNLAAVEARIERACLSVGRPRASVRLLPVTKTVPAPILRFAWAAGIRWFGENWIQEAAAKHAQLADLAVDWSIVGHLQTNKVKYVTRFAREFHALDSVRLAEALDARLAPEALSDFVAGLPRFTRLRPRGLMTLALFSAEAERVRPCFQLLRRLRDEAVKQNSALTELSMGMSGDFEEAIAQGADVVRVGEAIFGKRPTPDGHYWPSG